MRHQLVTLVLALGSTAVLADDVVARFTHESKPQVGSVATAGPGEVLYLEYEQNETRFAKLKNDARVSQSGMTLPKGLMLECDIAHGSGSVDCCKGYETALYCLQDRDHDGKFDRVKIVAGGKPLEHLFTPYETIWQTSESAPHWRKSLTYQGSAGGILRATFQGDGSGSGSQTHDLSFDLAKEGATDVFYEGMHLMITKVDASRIEYTVISGFSPTGKP